MSTVLAGVEPQEIWKNFEALAAIPRASTKEAAVREHILKLAESRAGAAGGRGRKRSRPQARLPWPRVRAGHRPAGPSGHGLRKERRHRVSTSIPMASASSARMTGFTAMAPPSALIMASAWPPRSPSWRAKPFDTSPWSLSSRWRKKPPWAAPPPSSPECLKARYLFNLDNEERGTLCIGCAGGLNTRATRRVRFQAPGADSACRVKVSGLKGGHSGVDIHLGRGNAIRILGGALQLLSSSSRWNSPISRAAAPTTQFRARPRPSSSAPPQTKPSSSPSWRSLPPMSVPTSAPSIPTCRSRWNRSAFRNT